MKRFICIVTIFLLSVGMTGPSSRGGDQEKEQGKAPRRVGELMRKKLEHSQKVLEGLAVNDYKAMAKHADELIDLSKQVEWRVLKTPQYEIHSNEFRRNCENLIKGAKDKNLDAAALAYLAKKRTFGAENPMRCALITWSERLRTVRLPGVTWIE